jgi:hypothetical protein
MDIAAIERPITQITPSNNLGTNKLNVHAKPTIVNSQNISHSPRVMRNNAVSFFVLPWLLYRNIEVPARKTKTGAQK